MKALLVRHGESASNADTSGAIAPDQGDSLTDLGREQADALGRAYADAGVTALISSSMGRARETAEAVGAHIGLEPVIDDTIHEYSEGESFEDFRGRARSLRMRLAADYAGDTPFCVTHGIFMRFFLLDAVLGDAFTPDMLDLIWNLRTANCGVCLFEYGEPYTFDDPKSHRWVCASWMERPWAGPSARP